MKTIKFGIAAFVTTVALVALLFLLSPFFHIQSVVIDGYFTQDPADILQRLEIENRQNILLWRTRAAQTRVLENFYIGHVDIRRQLPGRVVVTVRERRLTAYVQHRPDSILYLDDQGRVIDIRPYRPQGLPRLEGLAFTRFMLGEVLEVPDPVAFNTVVQYTQLLIQNDLIDRVSHINASDPTDIRIFIYNVTFYVGDARGADEKVRAIEQILQNTENVDRIPAFVNMRQVAQQYFMTILP
jgi:hypothetical protein